MADAFADAKKWAMEQIRNVISEAGHELADGTTIKEKAAAMITAYENYQQEINDYTEAAAQVVKHAKALKKLSANVDADSLSVQLEEAKQKAKMIYDEKNMNNHLQQALMNVYHVAKAFQGAVQQLSGTEIRMVFVTSGVGGSAPQVFDITDLAMEDYLYLDRAALSKGGGLVLRFKDLSAEALKSMGATQLTAQTEQYQAAMDNLYAEIRRRINIAKEKSGGVYLMYNIGEWHLIKVNTLGDLSEAYVNLLVNYSMYNKQETWLGHGSYDEQIHAFVHNYLWQVDNASGFLKEDVEVYDENGNLTKTLGVKSGGAQMMGLTQIYEFAKAIVNGGANQSALNRIAKLFGGTSGGAKRNPEIIGNACFEQIDKLHAAVDAMVDQSFK